MSALAVAITSSMREVPVDARVCLLYVLVDRGEIVYVGQTFCIEQRVVTHRRGTKQELPKLFTQAFCIEVSAADSDAVENALIRALLPRYNKHANTDSSRDAEMLARFGLTPRTDGRTITAHARRRQKIEALRSVRPALASKLMRAARRIERTL